jgi:hypothetical protein
MDAGVQVVCSSPERRVLFNKEPEGGFDKLAIQTKNKTDDVVVMHASSSALFVLLLTVLAIQWNDMALEYR